MTAAQRARGNTSCQYETHRRQLARHGIHHEPEALESERSEEGRDAFGREEDFRRAALPSELEERFPDRTCLLRAVGQRELLPLQALDAELPQHARRDDAVACVSDAGVVHL